MRGFLILLGVIFLFHPTHTQAQTKPRVFVDFCSDYLDSFFCLSLADSTIGLKDQAQEGFGIMLDTFHEDVRPKIVSSYKWYYDNYGTYVGENFWRSYDSIAPSVIDTYENTKDYWYKEYPDFFDELKYVPTPIKVAQEKLLFAVWDAHQADVQSGKRELPGIYLAAVEMLSDVGDVRNGKVKAPVEDQKRLERLLNDIRGASLDKDMANCFKVYAIPSKIANGFNTVCSIFINQPLYEMLNDDELRAVLAHEMGHGINGDSVKTFGNLLKITLNHFLKLGIEEFSWFLLDEEQEYFNQVKNEGNVNMIMHKAAEHAPVLEMNADVNGAKILNKAGYSANALILALYKLHGVEIGEKVEDHEDFKSFRNYPSLYKREQAIRKVMKF